MPAGRRYYPAKPPRPTCAAGTSAALRRHFCDLCISTSTSVNVPFASAGRATSTTLAAHQAVSSTTPGAGGAWTFHTHHAAPRDASGKLMTVFEVGTVPSRCRHRRRPAGGGTRAARGQLKGRRRRRPAPAIALTGGNTSRTCSEADWAACQATIARWSGGPCTTYPVEPSLGPQISMASMGPAAAAVAASRRRQLPSGSLVDPYNAPVRSGFILAAARRI